MSIETIPELRQLGILPEHELMKNRGVAVIFSVVHTNVESKLDESYG